MAIQFKVSYIDKERERINLTESTEEEADETFEHAMKVDALKGSFVEMKKIQTTSIRRGFGSGAD